MAAVAAVAAVAGAVYSVYAGQEQKKAMNEAADAQGRMAEINADNIRRENEEEARRLTRQQEQAEGLAKARAVASGLEGTSQDLWLSDMEKEHQRQMDWLLESGEMLAQNAQYSGYNAAQSTRNRGEAAAQQGIASGLQSVGSAAGYGQEAGWWS